MASKALPKRGSRREAVTEEVMTDQDVEKLMDRWAVDAAFRTALRRDPETAVREAGFTLTREERSVLASINWWLPVEEICGKA